MKTIKKMSIRITKAFIVTNISFSFYCINLQAADLIPGDPSAPPLQSIESHVNISSHIVPVADFLRVDFDNNLLFFSQEYINFYRERYNVRIVTDGERGKRWSTIIRSDVIDNAEGLTITEPYFIYAGNNYPLSFNSDPIALSKFFGFGISECMKNVDPKGLEYGAEKIWTVRLNADGKPQLEKHKKVIQRLTFVIENLDETRKKIAEKQRAEEEKKTEMRRIAAENERIAREKQAAEAEKAAKFKVGTLVYYGTRTPIYKIVGIKQNSNVLIRLYSHAYYDDDPMLEVSTKDLALYSGY
ncbi:MAG: hypothetical protein HQK53_15490 [Oligoflexia bacterium]|nr:hypothetical protein [Oligoflexia bacterium]